MTEPGRDLPPAGHPGRLIGGAERVGGGARYAADLGAGRMLHARPVLSPYASGRVLGVETGGAMRIPGVVAVLVADDLDCWRHPVNCRVSALLARDRVAFSGQPVAVVVAESEAAAADGAEAVEVDLEPLPPLVDAPAALRAGAPVIWPEGLSSRGFELQLPPDAGAWLMDGRSNVFEHRRYARGSLEAGFARADAVVAGTYRCASVHQGYLEPHAALAVPGRGGATLTIHTATRGPFHVRAWVARLLGLPQEAVRIVPAALGGSFGGKCGILEPLVGALAITLGRPVRLVLTRMEDLRTTTPSPAISIELALGATRRGELTALRGRVVVDNGAFPLGLGPHIADVLGGCYRCPNVAIEWLDVLTNRPQAGPLRAPGAPQAAFALESGIDELACRLGRDALELRLGNAAAEGDLSGTGQPLPGPGLGDCLARLREHPAWRDRRRPEGVGTGVAAGILRGPPAHSRAECRLDRDGGLELRLGCVDVSGAHTSLAQVAAAALGLPPDAVSVVAGDTASAPEDEITGSSKTTYAAAAAVRAAAADLRLRLERTAARRPGGGPGDGSRRPGLAELVRACGAEAVTGRGEAVLPPMLEAAAHLVRVEVDRETGEVRPLHWVAVHDVGFAVSPALVRGQVHGGVCQGLGFGLLEEFVFDAEGRQLTATLADYALPSIDSMPAGEVVLLERRDAGGPERARGVGEPPVIPGPAATANAVYDAVGVRARDLPITPERLWRALRGGGR